MVEDESIHFKNKRHVLFSSIISPGFQMTENIASLGEIQPTHSKYKFSSYI